MFPQPLPARLRAPIRPSRRKLVGAALALAALSGVGAWHATVTTGVVPHASFAAPEATSVGPALTVYVVRTPEAAALVRRVLGDRSTSTVLIADTAAAVAETHQTIKQFRIGLAGQPVSVVDLRGVELAGRR